MPTVRGLTGVHSVKVQHRKRGSRPSATLRAPRKPCLHELSYKICTFALEVDSEVNVAVSTGSSEVVLLTKVYFSEIHLH